MNQSHSLKNVRVGDVKPGFSWMNTKENAFFIIVGALKRRNATRFTVMCVLNGSIQIQNDPSWHHDDEFFIITFDDMTQFKLINA